MAETDILGDMRRRIALTLLLFAGAGATDEGPKFDSLKEAQATVLQDRAKILQRLEEERLLVPEAFLAAEEKRHEARRAWRDDRYDEARAAYRKAWKLYPLSLGRAQQEYTALTALREKRPPDPRLSGFREKRAVHSALEWLARHQDSLGRWDCAGFMKHDPKDDRCDGAGNKAYDVGVTALVVLAFLEAGFTDRDNHYALEVYKGLQWLRTQQDEQGMFGGGKPSAWVYYIYNHTAATLALAKACSLTKDERFKPSLQRALDYILRARAPNKGWRYAPDDVEADTSATTWCYRALVAGQEVGIELELDAAAAGSRAWLESMTLTDGRIGYMEPGRINRYQEEKRRFAEDRSRAMTAAGTVLRLLLDGKKHDKKLVQKSLDRCLERPPTWNPDDGSIDMYYWYYGTLACLVDKKRARKWKKPLHQALLKNQHAPGSGARAGSWDPVGVWGAEGGRVYATAILALALLHAG